MSLSHRTQDLPARIADSTSVRTRCADVGGRRRSTVVTLLGDNRIMVEVPPGEVAYFTWDETQAFRDVLRTAVLLTAEPVHDQPSTPGELPARFHASVPCFDGMSRQRVVRVTTTDDDRVTVAAPAGGFAILTPLQVGALRDLLREAAVVARTRSACAATEPVMQPASPTAADLAVAV